ncbi:MAG: DNA polymerase III subunit gamma and tau [Propionibacteriaceae bacterium]|nr:DNA polymerase III subunit gamma and tau [Propionibacteriaceae bacterium]
MASDAGKQPQTLALYRRYRPDTFNEVIGEEHVTEPLKRALINNRVNHAYLFSGPRGCGKTTSARILARCLNCEQGPTPTPCGVCQSCRELATGGSGSVDVIEIDAASHGQVDDARDLRDRVYYVPVNSRYKIYIVDEAHMVTTAGFNALLKVVEEPPPHVKFIFATTEPEKVIDTIRSRTHHYPFRLVPPKVMQSYLEKVCAEENVAVEQGVLALVVRAGAGSVRDSLSVLDQLLGAASKEGVTYAHAAALLGYTPDWLLDELVDAFGDAWGTGVFAAIDKVIEVGLDPKHFAEDLLQRLRDLMILARVSDAVKTGLLDLPEDQGAKYAEQASKLGPDELTRAAEVIAEGLTAMRGTTAPRLHLELMCARVLLPSADTGPRSVAARVERLERIVNSGGVSADATGNVTPRPRSVVATSNSPLTTQPPANQAVSSPRPTPQSTQLSAGQQPAAQQQRQQQAGEITAPPQQAPVNQHLVAQQPAEQRPVTQQPTEPHPTTQQPGTTYAPLTAATDLSAVQASVSGGADAVWGQLLAAVSEKKVFRALLSQFKPVTIDADVLVIEAQPALVQSQGGRATEVANQMLSQLSGALVRQVRVIAVGMGGLPAAANSIPTATAASVGEPTPQPATGSEPRQTSPAPTAPPDTPPPPPLTPAPLNYVDGGSESSDEDTEISDDDIELGTTGAVGLLQQEFGAEIITEEDL